MVEVESERFARETGSAGEDFFPLGPAFRGH